MNSIHLLNLLQGRELLWSTSDAALRVAIMETISRCSAPAAAAAPSSHLQDTGDDQRGMLLGTSTDQQENFQ